MKKCPMCGHRYVTCPECGEQFPHGTRSHCPNKKCQVVNALLDCYCGLVVAPSLEGVLDLDMVLIPYEQ